MRPPEGLQLRERLPTVQKSKQRVGRPGAEEIRRLDAEGKSLAEIAELLGITVQSVRNVLSGFSDEGQPNGLGLAALEAIRAADSPDHEWPVGELLSAFRFSTRIRTAIENDCEWRGITSLSLRYVFDLFVSDAAPPRPGIVITPFLSLRNAGTKGFWEAIDRISQLDMGQAANLLWRTKLQRLRLGERIRGLGRCSWTKPVRKTIPD